MWITSFQDVGEHSPFGPREVRVAVAGVMIMNGNAVKKVYRSRPAVSASSVSVASQTVNCTRMGCIVGGKACANFQTM